jgi:hypothetical protein
MSTELSTAPSSQFRAIADGASFAGSTIDFRSLVKVPFPKMARWSWDVLGIDFTEKALKGVVVINGPSELILWPRTNTSEGGSEGEKTLPAMRSPDGILAYRIGDDLGDLDPAVIEAAKVGVDEEGRDKYDVKRIPYFNWAKNAKGKNERRAKNTKVIGLLREGDISPLIIRLANTSVPVVDTFFAKVSQAFGCPHYGCVVELGLEHIKQGQYDYAKIVPKFLNPLDRDAATYLKAAYTDPLSPYAASKLDRVVRDSIDSVPF